VPRTGHVQPIVVFCPMQIEFSHVQRELRRAGLTSIQVMQTGIGKEAIIRAATKALDEQVTSARSGTGAPLLILAGACGGLIHVQDVPPIARVVDEHGHFWVPANADASGVTLAAVDRIVSTPADKAVLAQSTGASIVDMESHAFAAFCESRGVHWAVVRGVSDTPDETLPHEVLEWIAPDGGTRTMRAAKDLVLKPWLVPHIVSVVRRSNRVLPKVGRAVVEVVRRHSCVQEVAR
jgi:nucleoside phosphorylase